MSPARSNRRHAYTASCRKDRGATSDVTPVLADDSAKEIGSLKISQEKIATNKPFDSSKTHTKKINLKNIKYIQSIAKSNLAEIALYNIYKNKIISHTLLNEKLSKQNEFAKFQKSLEAPYLSVFSTRPETAIMKRMIKKRETSF